jgi:phosphate starvation-inducible membrane PsiE
MIWFHPPAISTMLVVIAAVLNLFIWVITTTLAIPIQKQLDQVKSTELIGRLVKVHLYLRLIPGSLNMIVTALIMYQVLLAAS